MGRNADGQGRKPHKWRGRWRAYLTVGYKPNGSPDRRYVYGATEGECLDKLDELRRQHRLGALGDASVTVADYLTDWLDQKRLEVKRRTVDEYERELAHALPHIGHVKLSQLTALHVQRMMRAVNGGTTITRRTLKSGVVKERRFTLTARAANQARGILSNALDDAVRAGIIPSNPARRVKPLRHEAVDAQVWTAAEVERFLNTTRAGAAAQHALFYLALTTGMRAGELIALEWGDVTATHIHVRRTITREAGRVVVGPPKSRASNRTIALPPDARQVLVEHRAGLTLEGVDSPLVFPTGGGGMLTHSNLRRALRTWAERAEVPLIRPHDLRHTYASMVISAGVNASELARQLGHSDPGFTLRRYVHFFERAKPREAPTLRALLGGPEPRGGTQGGTGAPEPN